MLPTEKQHKNPLPGFYTEEGIFSLRKAFRNNIIRGMHIVLYAGIHSAGGRYRLDHHCLTVLLQAGVNDIRPLGALRTEVEGNDHRKDGDKLLPGDDTSQRQDAEHNAQRQGYGYESWDCPAWKDNARR